MFSVGSAPAGAHGDFSKPRPRSFAADDVGLQTGHGEMAYEFVMPPAPGPVPELSLSYSSGRVDGLVSDRNTQGSEVGLGWELSRPVITRQLSTCTDTAGEGNKCWVNGDGDSDGFSITLNGVSSRLARVSATEYRLEVDNG